MRYDGRQFSQLRDINIQRGFIENADSSVLISLVNQSDLSASIEDSVPRFLKDSVQVDLRNTQCCLVRMNAFVGK